MNADSQLKCVEPKFASRRRLFVAIPLLVITAVVPAFIGLQLDTPVAVQYQAFGPMNSNAHAIRSGDLLCRGRGKLRFGQSPGEKHVAGIVASAHTGDVFSDFAEALLKMKLYYRSSLRFSKLSQNPEVLRGEYEELFNAYSLLLAIKEGESEIGLNRDFNSTVGDCRMLMVNHVNRMVELGYSPEK